MYNSSFIFSNKFKSNIVPSIRIKRILKRDLMDQNSILKRIDNQMSDSEKLKYADYIIKNNGNRTSLKNEVQNIIDQLF